MKNICLVLSLLSCVACSAMKQVAPTENTCVEVRTRTVLQKDTVYLELPVIEKVVETRDTSSTIENRYAKSTASVQNGALVHSLFTKPVNEPVIVDNKVVYRDSLVYVDRVKEVKGRS